MRDPLLLRHLCNGLGCHFRALHALLWCTYFTFFHFFAVSLSDSKTNLTNLHCNKFNCKVKEESIGTSNSTSTSTTCRRGIPWNIPFIIGCPLDRSDQQIALLAVILCFILFQRQSSLPRWSLLDFGSSTSTAIEQNASLTPLCANLLPPPLLLNLFYGLP